MRKIIILLFCTSLLKIHAQIFTQSSTNGAITITPNGLRGNGNNSNNTLNVSLGMNSLFSNSTGNENTAIGGNALSSSVNGFENTAIGSKSMQFLTGTAHYNTAIGAGSMAENPLSVDGNTGVGRWALNKIQTGCCNTAVGEGALSGDISGASNVAIGSWALNSLAGGSDNTAVGVGALYISEGSMNTALGRNALSSNTIGSLNVAIGSLANFSTNNLTNAIVIGSNAIVNASNKIRLGNSNITVIEGQVAWSNPSDKRLKENIIYTNRLGLDFIKKLQTVSYNYIADNTKTRYDGFIAQDIEKIMNDLGVPFSALKKSDDGTLSLAYSDFVIPLVNAVKEQNKIIERVEIQLINQKEEIIALRKIIEKLQEK
jgi:hypothetical protein